MSNADLAAALGKFDRLCLGHWPTPLQPLGRLSEALGGPRLWMKRDDCCGLGFGGNKVRKLEFLMADAAKEGAGTIITVGGVQSNHACQTAAAAAKLGLKCHLVLLRVVPGQGALYESAGNIPAEHLFGASVHIVDIEEDAMGVIARLIEEADQDGLPAYLVPAGGSSPVGVLGFVAAALELDEQENLAGRRFDRIVLAASTAGTLAGLAVGLSVCGAQRPIEAVMVYEPSNQLRPKAEALVGQTAELLNVPSPGLGKVHFHDDYLGEGYGLPGRAAKEALSLLASMEGVLVDPVYTGKAMAGLIDFVRSKRFSETENVLFWHTGGVAALSAYPELF